ncbi:MULTISPECIES: response regulator [unclassified Microcoleus]|uniref:response regulator n=1 Tax=unclassified Microcoleus TaxID=2642155 RepID=UPI0025D70861|nr:MULTISPECIES: response regulator [unclassified Microcoleus]
MSKVERTVLIVEDNPEDTEMYRRYLLRDREYNYTIVAAKSGQQGLALWQQHQPDVVLLDYRLPDLDGLEFLAAWETEAQQPNLPVIMVTGQGNEAIAVQAIKAGAQDYLVKGQITPESLQLAVHRTIAAVELRQQLQQRIDRERAIARIAQKVHGTLNLEEILYITVEEVRQFLHTDRAIVFRLEPDGIGTVMAESVGDRWISILSAQIYDPCFVESYVDRYRLGMVSTKADIHDGSISPCHVELLSQYQVKANLVVPILHEDQFWGVLIAHHCASPREWQPLEIDLLQELSIQVSIAIRQAELYEQAQREIAERKRTEEALGGSEERLRLGLDAARMGTWDWNIPDNHITWSSNMEDLFGLAPGEFEGSYYQFVERLHPEDRDRVLEAIDAAIATGANYEIEFRVIYPNGRIRWALSLGKVFYNELGQAIRMSGVDLDITPRKHTEEALRHSEEFRKRVLDSSSDCIKVLDLDARLLYMNAGGLCLLEIDDLTPYLNAEWLCFWQDEAREEVEAAIAVAKAGEVARFQGFCATAKGTPKWWDVVLAPIRDVAGQVVQILSTSRDITDRKQAEIERERILQLKQAALAESERVNRIKDEFLAVLSHELRSPLNPILGWTKLLQTGRLDETKTVAALATIERNALAQAQLIDDLLDMASVLRGKLSLNVTAVNLLSTIESAIETVQTAATAKSIVIHPVLSNIGQVSGDGVRLQQIVWNLLSNAVKFTPKGGRVDIKLESADNQAQIVVTDTGKGINRDFLPYIFESFRQEDASVTRKHGGLGLGLAIVYQLVEAHGGTIKADSFGEGKGATFRVTLPLLNVKTGENPDKLLEAEQDLRGIRVLAIDDEADSREVIGAFLVMAGAQVMTVASAAEFIVALESFVPDVLVSDIGMPEMDGYSLIGYVRSLSPERGGLIPAIALTAYAGEINHQQALAAGFQRHISKPVEPNLLVGAIGDLLSK